MPAVSRVIIPVGALLLFGVLLIVCGFAVVPYVVNKKLQESVKLVPESQAYNTWIDPPAPIFTNFYFFNVTNSDQFIANSTRPHVEQIGPYVYKEIRNKTDISLINDGITLRYRQNKFYVFDRNQSCGEESDLFTTINIPLVTMADEVRQMSEELQFTVTLAISYSGLHLFEQRTVKELLWGYHPALPPVITDLLKKLNLYPTWGIYVGASANGTDDGMYEVDSGKSDVSQLGQVTSWRESRSLPYWSDPNCNMINGTDGSFWHPLVSESERLYIFNSDLCRSIYVTSNNSQSKVRDITTYHFTPPSEVFASFKENADNLGFCVPAPDCLGSGVLDVSKCKGAPIVMSQPHFYQADLQYQEAIDGIHPNSSYLTFIDVEPNTGYTLSAEKKIQVNVYLRKLSVLREMDNIKDNRTIFPVFWLNENAIIGDDEAKKFTTEVLHPIYLAQVARYCLYSIGIAILCFGIVLLLCVLLRRPCHLGSKHVQITQNDDDDDARLIDAGTA